MIPRKNSLRVALKGQSTLREHSYAPKESLKVVYNKLSTEQMSTCTLTIDLFKADAQM